jgi:hypothetical protein
VLIEHLPPESATMTALRNANPDSVSEDGPDPAKGRWSQVEVLLASAVDELRYLRHEYRKMNGDKRSKAPDPIRRPGVVDKSKKNELSEDQYDWLYRHINGLDHPDGGGFVEVSIDMKPLTPPAQPA